MRVVYLAYILTIVYLVIGCTPKDPSPDYISDFTGTYTGYAFANEQAVINKVSNAVAKVSYTYNSNVYSFNLNYADGTSASSQSFLTNINYFTISNSQSNPNFVGGKVDYDSLVPGVQNAKLSKTIVFGTDYSFRFSAILNDTTNIVRTFSK